MRSQNDIKIRASALPTVITLSVVILLSIIFFISFSELNYTMFNMSVRKHQIKDNIHSARTLYITHPELLDPISDSVTITLYPDDPRSAVSLRRDRWGLYEIICFTSQGESEVSVMGLREANRDSCTFLYANNFGALQLTGYTNLEGRLMLPDNGVSYPQLGGQFFSGRRLEKTSKIDVSPSELPQADTQSRHNIKRMFDHIDRTTQIDLPENIKYSFDIPETGLFRVADTMLTGCRIQGRVMVIADFLRVDSSAKIHDAIVVARKVIICRGFVGRVQIFASDSIIVEPQAILEYPSGLFANQFIEIKDSCRVSGYVVIDNARQENQFTRNYIQSRLSRVRGLVWIDGNAQTGGITIGSTQIKRAVYTCSSGSYLDLIHDASFLEAKNTGYPLWLDHQGDRKEVFRLK